MQTPSVPRRLLSSPNVQAVLALIGGTLAGTLIGPLNFGRAWADLWLHGSETIGFLVLTMLRALAVPIIVYSAVLGGTGLEAMRGMGRVAGKMLAWTAASSLLAPLLAVALFWWPGLTPLSRTGIGGYGTEQTLPRPTDWGWGWAGLVFLALTAAFYRNQIDEGQGKLLMRFCLALEGMWTPLLRWARSIAPIGIFFLAAATSTVHAPTFRFFVEQGSTRLLYLHRSALWLGLAIVLIYPLLLSGGVWWMTRVNVWRSVGSLLPALGLAASGQSVEGALPLAFQTLREKGGVSNRIAGVVLPVGTILHRDGCALVWTWAMLCTWMQHPYAEMFHYWQELSGIVALGWLVGSGLSGLSGNARLVQLLLWSATGWADGFVPVLLGWFIVSIGGAISVFSQYCAAIVIARSEGEYWVPGPPPNADELQELKSTLESAEG